MDTALHKALAATAPALAAHAAARWPSTDAAERGAVEHSDAVRRLRVAVWADRIREGGR